MVWFAIATVLSAFLPNTVVAAAMIPIVLAMLRFIGIEDIGKSAFGSALLIAIAWGTSVGGFWTPLGGAPNLLTIKLLQQTVISHEFLFMTWVTRSAPAAIASQPFRSSSCGSPSSRRSSTSRARAIISRRSCARLDR